MAARAQSALPPAILSESQTANAGITSELAPAQFPLIQWAFSFNLAGKLDFCAAASAGN